MVLLIKQISSAGKFAIYCDGIKIYEFTQNKYNTLLPFLLHNTDKPTKMLSELIAVYKSKDLIFYPEDFIKMFQASQIIGFEKSSIDSIVIERIVDEALEYVLKSDNWIAVGEQIYRYENYIYKMVPTADIKKTVLSWWKENYPETYLEKHGTEVINQIITIKSITTKCLNQPYYLVPFKNGYYDLNTRSFIYEHHPEYHFLDGFDFDYHPILKTAKWQDKPVLALYHLYQMFPNSQKIQDEILTATCNSITNDMRYQRGFVLLGEKNCGKSTWMEIIKGMVGNDFFEDFTPKDFDKKEQKVVYGAMFNKKVANCDEIETSSYWSTDVQGGIKHIITTKTITGRKLFKDEITIPNKIHVWVTANYLARLYEYEEGFGRRWGGMWYSTQTYIKSVDIDRAEDILLCEKQKLVNYLLTNYSDFTCYLTVDSTENLNFWQSYASNIFKFIRDKCVVNLTTNPPIMVKFDIIYDAYCKYTQNNKVKKEDPLSWKAFGMEMHKRGIKTKVVGVLKEYYYEGIKLKENYEIDDMITEPIDNIPRQMVNSNKIVDVSYKFEGFNDMI